MERPALQRLLADVDQGVIDVVVVYKVDRLTRSLTDFAKMVEVFDAHAVSFVAVTQQFNTTTSMGRLTLNVLLSFARLVIDDQALGVKLVGDASIAVAWELGTQRLNAVAQNLRRTAAAA